MVQQSQRFVIALKVLLGAIGQSWLCDTELDAWNNNRGEENSLLLTIQGS